MHLLSPLGWLYGQAVNIRNALYDRGSLASYSLGARTISFGNITVGGTGKTPLVALAAEMLTESGERVCILTRGYGRETPRSRVLVSDGESVLVDARIGGDEPVELANKLIGKALVIADADRVAAAKWAVEKFGVTAFVLDDGFQHRRAKRDLDVVCIDATAAFGSGKVVPAGKLREPAANLNRADVIVITRADLIENTDGLRNEITRFNPHAPIFLAENRISRVSSLQEFTAESLSSANCREHSVDDDWKRLFHRTGQPGEDKEVRIGGFCGLGNPAAFYQLVAGAFSTEPLDESTFVEIKTLPDHHTYRRADIDAIEKRARAAGVNVLVTTAKDAVKLKSMEFELPCFVIEIRPDVSDPDKFRTLITASS